MGSETYGRGWTSFGLALATCKGWRTCFRHYASHLRLQFSVTGGCLIIWMLDLVIIVCFALRWFL